MSAELITHQNGAATPAASSGEIRATDRSAASGAPGGQGGAGRSARHPVVLVGRLHLVDRLGWIALPLMILASSFLINYLIWVIVGRLPDGNYTGGLAFLPSYAFALGIITITKTLHFAFSLSVTRRTYFLGTWGTGLMIGAVTAVGTVLLARIEAATDGWGYDGHYFRIPWLLDGPWYQDLAVMFALMSVVFALGMWVSLFTLRRGVTTLLVTLLGWAIGLALVGVLVTWQEWWGNIGDALAGLSPFGLAGILAGLTALAGLGGYNTIRRLTL